MASENSRSFGTKRSTSRERSQPHLKSRKCSIQLKLSQMHESLIPKTRRMSFSRHGNASRYNITQKASRPLTTNPQSVRMNAGIKRRSSMSIICPQREIKTIMGSRHEEQVNHENSPSDFIEPIPYCCYHLAHTAVLLLCTAALVRILPLDV